MANVCGAAAAVSGIENLLTYMTEQGPSPQITFFTQIRNMFTRRTVIKLKFLLFILIYYGQ